MNKPQIRKNLQDSYKSWPPLIQKTAQLISACAVIFGFICAGLAWIKNSITLDTQQQINNIASKIDKLEHDNALSLKRLELMALIQNNPENTAGIHKVAYRYFAQLGGDWYMTRVYSEWAAKYGGDTSLIKNTK